MNYFKRVWITARYSGPSALFFDALARTGILIQPYFIVLEGLDHTQQHLKPALTGYEMGYMGPKDMKIISTLPMRRKSEEDLLFRLKNGDKCFHSLSNMVLSVFSCNILKCYWGEGFCSEVRQAVFYGKDREYGCTGNSSNLKRAYGE